MYKFISIQFLRNKAVFLSLLALSFALPQVSYASLIGQTVTVTYQDNSPFSSSDTVTVGAGAEIMGSDNTKNLTLDSILLTADFIDITATGIVIQMSGGGTNMGSGFTNAGFDGLPGARFEFTNFNFLPDLLSGVNVVLTNATGLTNADVVFTANSVTLNNLGNLGILGSTVQNQGQIALNFQVSPNPVPLPGTLGLFGFGLAALGSLRGKRSKHNNS
jgi:hypothetical protein